MPSVEGISFAQQMQQMETMQAQSRAQQAMTDQQRQKFDSQNRQDQIKSQHITETSTRLSNQLKSAHEGNMEVIRNTKRG